MLRGERINPGSSTLFTTWITPFDWYTLAMVTMAVPPLASVTITLPPLMVAVSVPPLAVFSTALPPPALMALMRAGPSILPGTTWYVSTLVSVALFSGLSSVSTVPAGSAAKAALVGANTVNGPGLFSVSTRPAAFTAATSVVWSLELTALSTMSFVGYIAAPPTIGLDDMPVLPLPLMPMPPAQAPSRTETPTAIMSFFIEGSWREMVLGRCLWKPPSARRRDALESNTGAFRVWIRTRFQICGASALRHSRAGRACASHARRPPRPDVHPRTRPRPTDKGPAQPFAGAFLFLAGRHLRTHRAERRAQKVALHKAAHNLRGED
jgi:hypothetical protein